MTTSHSAPMIGDNVSVKRWFLFYAAVIIAAATVLVWLLYRQPPEEWASWGEFKLAIRDASTAVKLLVLGIYLSVCCTFLPLNTTWIVAAVATRRLAVGAGIWDTTLMVAAVGAVASTIANMHDYYLFTWMLRSHCVAKLRKTAFYRTAAQWYARAPFFWLAVFNLVPIPVDMVRLLATTYRYPRIPFALASFVGRFVRYGVIAYLLYRWNPPLEITILVFVGVAVAIMIGRWGYQFFLSPRNETDDNPNDDEKPQGDSHDPS